ncbi:MAG: hypothetical protein PHV93_02725 [Candidatus Pacebacteria bacterium]|nr:hypothetical protein [Candidatus Paceibacterota bacterium]
MGKLQHFFRGFLKKGNKRPERRVWPRSERNWELLLASFFLLFIIGAVASAYLFRSISRGEIFRVETPTNNQTSVIDQDLLKNTIDFYQNKALNLKEITTHSKVLVDPSI